MFSKRNEIIFLKDILSSCDKIERYVGQKQLQEFIKDEILVDAVLRNLELIGEAVKRISPHLKKANDVIEWRKIAGLRDILIHKYFGIDYEIVWDIIKNKIPLLKREIVKLLKSSNEDS